MKAKFLLPLILLATLSKAQVIFPNREKSEKHFFLSEKLKTNEDYVANTVIFKMKPEYSQSCKQNSIDNIVEIQDYLTSLGIQNLGKIFPNHRTPSIQRNSLEQPLVDLSLIYSFTYNSNTSLEKVINEMRALGYFEYVEPWYIPQPLSFTPNDNGGQDHLKGNIAGSLDAEDAWALTKGDTSVVIGIVDSGIESHPDLDGNYRGGYDIGTSTPNPTCILGSCHGVEIAGAADAVTNNGIGIASPGFNCKFKAIKATDSVGNLLNTYAGIVWAADNGCKIINCSWGGTQSSAFEQNIVDYATINKNCLIICAAGNTSTEQSIYPGSYDHTYRVASTMSLDSKSGFSSYGCDVDFSAPGSIIHTTIAGGSYGAIDGTSMASAVASGAAALVESYFHFTNAAQIGEKLKQSCDPYVGTTSIILFLGGKLGNGRIDLYKALTIPAQSIVMDPINVTDGNDNIFMPSETLSISGAFINYLDPCSASTVATLSIVSGPASIVVGNYPIGALVTLGTKTMATPFTAIINSNASVNSVIQFKVTITDGTHSDSKCFDVPVNSNTTGISSNNALQSLVKIYPNPTTGLVHISCPENTTELFITDLVGRKVFVFAGKNEKQIDLSGQPRGVYFLNVRTENGVAVKKIIKE